MTIARAIKLDPGFVEAWFNLAGLLTASAATPMRRAGICRRRSRSIADYADAVFNLARLEFDAGNLAEARALVGALSRARRPFRMGAHGRRGIQFVDLHLAPATAG